MPRSMTVQILSYLVLVRDPFWRGSFNPSNPTSIGFGQLPSMVRCESARAVVCHVTGADLRSALDRKVRRTSTVICDIT